MTANRTLPVLLIATRNAHKAGEIRAVLGGGFRYLTLNDFPDAPQVVEDAGTFADNAAKKAVQLARWFASTDSSLETQDSRPKTQDSRLKTQDSRLWVLADDSGLEVDALHGAPGVHSARFAALDSGGPGNSSDAENNDKLLRLLKDVPTEKRTARFRCVLVLAAVERRKSGVGSKTARSAFRAPRFFDGACEGHIDFTPRGQAGFGYDPLFVPEGSDQTFGELGEEAKNRVSHRFKALAKMRVWLARAEPHR